MCSSQSNCHQIPQICPRTHARLRHSNTNCPMRTHLLLTFYTEACAQSRPQNCCPLSRAPVSRRRMSRTSHVWRKAGGRSVHETTTFVRLWLWRWGKTLTNQIKPNQPTFLFASTRTAPLRYTSASVTDFLRRLSKNRIITRRRGYFVIESFSRDLQGQTRLVTDGQISY